MSRENTNYNSLDDVVNRVSAVLSELSQTCLELQSLRHSESSGLDSDGVIKAQALDRVTQYLECLAAFNEALSSNPIFKSIPVGDHAFEAINLPSLQQVLDASMTSTDTDSDDIELFA